MSALPPSPTRLIGREVELDEAVRAARTAAGRLVTITGSGGSGKSRLAVEVARTLAAEFAGGTVLVDLAQVDSPERVAGAIAHALGFIDMPGADPLERLVSGLALQHRLVVLDNFEHLIESALPIANVASRCPGSVLLITSRRHLNVRGELVLPLGALALPPAPGAPSPHALEAVASVVLFCERARAVDSGFAADNRTLETIGEICRALDGLPLAIELTASWTRLLPPEALLARLIDKDDSAALDLIGRGATDTANRHRTMRDTIRWSYDLLDEPSRALLRRVSVFAGGWTLDAMEAICADDPSSGTAWDALVELVDLHLVDPVAPIEDGPQFRLLETVRRFAGEELKAHGQLEALAGRHADYFAALARRVGRELETGDGRQRAAGVDHELPDIRRALEHLASTGRHAAGLDATVALAPYWLDRGPVHEARYWLDRFLAAGGGSAELNATAEGWSIRFAIEAGEIETEAGDDPLDRLTRAQRVIAATGDDWGRLRIADHISYLLRLRGQFDELDRLFDETLSRDEPGEFGWVEVDLMARRATVARDRDDAATALALLQETMAVARRTGHDRAWIRAALGYYPLRGGPPAQTRQDLRETFELSERIGDKRGAAMSASVSGMVALYDGDRAASVRWLRACLDLGLGSGYWHAVCWAVMGTVVVGSLGDFPAEAARLHGAVLPSLPAMRTQIAPAFLATYDEQVASLTDRLGADTFAGECQVGELGGWQLAAENARQLTDQMLLELGGAQPSSSEPVVPPSVTSRRRGGGGLPELTAREREVLGELVGGQTNQAIARSLGLSPKTVMHHTGSVYRKLGVRGRAEAVAHALRTGLIA